MSSAAHESTSVSVVRLPTWIKVLSGVVCATAGGVLGAFLPRLAAWAAEQPWIPFFQGPLDAVGSIDAQTGEPVTIGLIAAGVLAGLWFAVLIDRDMLTAEVTGRSATLRRGSSARTLDASGVAEVLFDQKSLVVLGHRTEEVFREKTDLAATRYRRAFVEHGYTWRDGDPYASQFRLWAEGDPALPPEAHDLLVARAASLGRKDGASDAVAARSALDKLGVVVKDEKKRQLWRPISPASS